MQKKKMKDTATVSAPSRMTRRGVVCISRGGVERVKFSRSRYGDDLQIQRQPACKKSLLIRESLRHEARRLGNTKVCTHISSQSRHLPNRRRQEPTKCSCQSG